MKQIVAAIFALLTQTAPVLAEGAYQDGDELRLVQMIDAYINDQVVDGCLPQPDILATETELILRRSDISVARNPTEIFGAEGGYSLQIKVVGYELSQPAKGNCVAYLGAELYRFAQMPEGHYAVVTAYTKATLLSWGKSEIQRSLREKVSAMVTDLANEILKAREQ